MKLTLALPAFQLPLNGLANEVRPVLAIIPHRINTVERPFGEAGHHVFAPSFFASHRLFLI